MAKRPRQEIFWQVTPTQVVMLHMSGHLPSSAQTKALWEPQVDVYESAESFIIKAELAGVHPESITLQYVPGRHSLLIQGYRAEDHQETEASIAVHQLEILYGEFSREVSLPKSPVEPEQLKATFRNGILSITLPKARVRITHTFTIKTV